MRAARRGLALCAALPLAAAHADDQPMAAVCGPAGAVLTTAMMWIAARRQRRSDTVEADLREIADAMQRALLRPVPEGLVQVSGRVRYLAAAAQARVGGDLYDVADTPYGVRVIVGDVMGKGLAAVEQASDVLGAFRELAHHEKSLPVVAARLDAFLATRGREEEFVTAFLAEISESGDSAELVTCGHPPPLLLSGGRVSYAELVPAPPLGLVGLGGGCCASATVELAPGDRMLLYTDGVSDARDASGRFYPSPNGSRRCAATTPTS
ncbi:PP2C family protein-serine/threonine phosphatase [Actinomadura yumaensis]|uniref:PP2C family protein-serine/threonine phosphatase n=1 Tax=Actinomadura yumaensis TaxID=111807 RepID=UPI00360E3292